MDGKHAIEIEIDHLEEELLHLSHQIHHNPELGFEEFQAVEWIGKVLEGHGFQVDDNYCGLPTSFRATARGRGEGPRLAFLAEYDALPGIGHGCGHNIIATCAVGAFLGLAAVIKELDGEISLIGTPAEEGGAGKVLLLERGGFEDVQFALMMHPSGAGYNLVGRGGRASCSVGAVFHGKSAHSSTPAMGVNALTAVISVFNQIDMLRATFQPQDNINGVILEGGVASNVIPERAACEFCLRADTMKRVKELEGLVTGCVRRAEEITGAKADISLEPVYAERYPNLPMCQAFKENMESMGVPMEYADPAIPCGSSDIGNVSIKIPAIHDYLSITEDAAILSHSPQFAQAAASRMADRVCILGAKGLAMTAYDILVDTAFQERILKYHRQQVPDFYFAG